MNELQVQNRFTPLQTYKGLKHKTEPAAGEAGFTPLQTYKVLKRIAFYIFGDCVLHHYKLTRFSNYELVKSRNVSVLHHYKLTRFSNVILLVV